jgi:hypothetical protein
MRLALETALKAEVEHNAIQLMVKIGEHGPVSAFDFLPRGDIELTGDLMYSLSGDLRDRLMTLLALADRTSTLKSSALREALASGEFLAFDPETHRMVPTAEMSLLERLLARIERLEDLRKWIRTPSITGEWAAFAESRWRDTLSEQGTRSCGILAAR